MYFLSLEKVYTTGEQESLISDILTQLESRDEDEILVLYTAAHSSNFNAVSVYPQVFYILAKKLKSMDSLYRLEPKDCSCTWDTYKCAYIVRIPLTRFGLLDLVGSAFFRLLELGKHGKYTG